MADVAYRKSLYGASARLYEEAFAGGPDIVADPRRALRYNAACAAVLAGSGRGRDETAPNPEGRTRFRDQAHEWLAGDLAAWRKLMESDSPEYRSAVQQTLRYWLTDSDLASVREDKSLMQPPST